jgi:hypothetical protein
VIRSVTFLGIFLTLACSAHRCFSAEQTAIVEIVPLTINGGRVQNGRVDLLQHGTRKSFGTSFRQWRGTNIPYGEYVLRVEAPGFRTHEQNLRVYRPSVTVRIGLRVTLMDDEPVRVVQGRVIAADRDIDELWIKLVPILAGGPPMDARVATDGTFSLGGIDPGEYLLMVIRGTAVIHTKQKMLFGDETIDIALTHQLPRP